MYTVWMSKTLLFQAILFSVGIVFVHMQLNVKTVLFQTIKFSMQNSSISNNSL